MKHPFVAATALCLVAIAVPAEETPPRASSPASLPAVLAAVNDRNPDIRAARQAWQAKRHDIGPAGAWPNPTFTFEDERFPGNDTFMEESLRRYRLEQDVPFPGKLSREAWMKKHEALIAEENYRAKGLEMAGQARIAYYRLYLASRKIELADTTVTALRGVLQTAQSRLASGQSSASDVFMAQLELRKMENALFEQKQARTLAEIDLNVLLDQPTETRWGDAAPPALIDIPASLDTLKSVSRLAAPAALSAAHERNHARAALGLSRLSWAPDFSLMYEREVPDERPAGRNIGVGVTFPLWISRPRGLLASAQAHMEETEALVRGMENSVYRAVHTEFVETTTRLTLARNYERDVLPTAQSNLRVAREQYASGRGDFLRVLEALRTWIDTNNEYEDELYQYGQHWTMLEQAVGTDLTKVNEVNAHEK